MEKKVIIIILVVILLALGGAIAFFYVSGSGVEYPMVPGYSNGQYAGNVFGGKETPESCKNWATENELLAYGYRNENHPQQSYKNSCFGYHRLDPHLPNLDDTVHSVACTDSRKSVKTGCI